MTLRGFLIGLVGVLGLALLTPVNDYAVGNTYLTGNHFPVGVFFFMLVLLLGFNVAARALRRGLELRREELMLVLCMMLVAATVPASGLMRYWFPVTASPAYLAQRADFFWEDTVLERAPEDLLLSTDMRSQAVHRFFEGTAAREAVRVPWARWMPVITSWGIFIAIYYLGTFFLMGMLRRQWVEHERLAFPIARYPLDLTEQADRQLLPPLMRTRAFLVGAAAALALALIQLSPVFAGAEQGMVLSVPVQEFLQGTPLQNTPLRDGRIFPIAVAMAFLVPAEVSLSMWLFYILTCLEVHLLNTSGVPIEGGAYRFVEWQQAGAFIAFTGGVLWMARRHLWRVLLSALGRSKGQDEDEPIPYRLSFWGLVACVIAALLWYAHYGVGPLVGLLLMLLIMTVVIVHARLVCQGGVILTGQSWQPPELFYGLFGGWGLLGSAAVVTQIQTGFLWRDSREILSPHVMNALRISSAFRRRKWLFLPVMIAALLVALAAGTYSSLQWVYYRHGALNLANTHAINWGSILIYAPTHEMIRNSPAAPQAHYVGLACGAVVMTALQTLRTVFYWWPINPLGFLISASWAIRPLWFSFLIGWLVKRSMLRFGSGGVLRGGRRFFLGVVTSQVALIGALTFISLLTDVRFGYLFMPS